MFCFQCEQTFNGKGCTIQGVCGKDDTTATLQDLLIYQAKGIAQYAHRAAKLGKHDNDIGRFVAQAMFSTLTNVNFDPQRLREWIGQAAIMRDKAKDLYHGACKKAGCSPEVLSGPAVFEPADTIDSLLEQGRQAGVVGMLDRMGKTEGGLMQFITHAIKGVSAYTDHAQILGVTDDAHYASIYEALDYVSKERPDFNEEVGWLMKAGQINLKAMELLDKANTTTYGQPAPTRVRMSHKKGKAILVSGHDLLDLHEILRQTEGKGINVYTHGEMLAAHGYPGLKKYSHLAGNFGGAWQNQIHEFPNFKGPIVMTTNCLQRPKEEYKSRLFSTNLVAWPGVAHIKNHDFTQVVQAALDNEGFLDDGEEKYTTVGFARNAILENAGKVIELVKAGKIRHIFLIGGCDGAKPGRNYYTEFASKVPKDCIILTLACGKYRFNGMDFGDIEGIPRLLDCGQCNDAYSAIKVAVALGNAFGKSVNELPLSMVLSWYEQKAVAVLSTLLSLGVKNIRIGPSLPASLTPQVLEALGAKYNIMPIKTPEEDLKTILG